MPSISATVTTPDGTCPVTLHTPNGTGPWSAVVMYPDAGGVRPTFQDMAARLAGFGHAVLLPDVYYRQGDWEPFEMETVFGDPEQRKRLMTMVGSVTPEMIASDAAAFFDFLAARPEVKGDAFGVCGYCMGGRTSVIAAGRVPDRVAAAGSFHGGGLVTANPNSPHLLAPKIHARMYFGVAKNDDDQQPDAKDKLREAMAAAKVPAEIEVYPSQHGWCMSDFVSATTTIYDKAQAERAWGKLLALYKVSLA